MITYVQRCDFMLIPVPTPQVRRHNAHRPRAAVRAWAPREHAHSCMRRWAHIHTSHSHVSFTRLIHTSHSHVSPTRPIHTTHSHDSGGEPRLCRRRRRRGLWSLLPRGHRWVRLSWLVPIHIYMHMCACTHTCSHAYMRMHAGTALAAGAVSSTSSSASSPRCGSRGERCGSRRPRREVVGAARLWWRCRRWHSLPPAPMAPRSSSRRWSFLEVTVATCMHARACIRVHACTCMHTHACIRMQVTAATCRRRATSASTPTVRP